MSGSIGVRLGSGEAEEGNSVPSALFLNSGVFLNSQGTRGAMRLLHSNPGTPTDTLNGIECGVNSIVTQYNEREITPDNELLRGFSIEICIVQVSSSSYGAKATESPRYSLSIRVTFESDTVTVLWASTRDGQLPT